MTVTFRQNQLMLSSEFDFNTFILINCKLSTWNQELSSKSFSRKARLQIPAKIPKTTVYVPGKDAFKPIRSDYCTVGPTDRDLQGESLH